MTQPRRAVVAALAGSREHLSAEEILVDASKAYPGVNRSTIYRALETLADLGVVQHIHSGRAATLYHLTSDAGPHAHATCDSAVGSSTCPATCSRRPPSGCARTRASSWTRATSPSPASAGTASRAPDRTSPHGLGSDSTGSFPIRLLVFTS